MNDSSPEIWTYLVGFGANLPSKFGEPLATVRWALDCFAKQPGWSVRVSRFYRTPIFPPEDVPDFVNAVAEITCPLPPVEVLGFAHELEAICNRTRSRRWESRTLDIDILATNQMVLPEKPVVQRWMNMGLSEQEHAVPDEMLLPHPRLHERGFVLIPLLDVAPDWIHPIQNQSVRKMVQMLPEIAIKGVVPMGDLTDAS